MGQDAWSGWLAIVAYRVATIGVRVLAPTAAGDIPLVGGVLVVEVTIACSYIVWRDDPDRQSAVSTPSSPT